MLKIIVKIDFKKLAVAELIHYLKTLKDNNINAIFVTLINSNKKDLETLKAIQEATQIIIYGQINNHFIEQFNLNINKVNNFIAFFKNYNLAGISLDDSIDLYYLAKLSKNRVNFKIIFNGAYAYEELKTLVTQYYAKTKNLLNFYPNYQQKYTGASLEFFSFNQTESLINNIPFGPVISSNDIMGTSLEIHRDWDLATQIRHCIALCVDIIIIANLKLTEINIINNINYSRIALEIQLTKNISVLEQEILFDQNKHFVRKDLSQNLIRSGALKPETRKIPPKLNEQAWFEVGDIVIINDKHQDCGELQLITTKIKNDGIRNLVAKVKKEYFYFFMYLTTMRPFLLFSNE